MFKQMAKVSRKGFIPEGFELGEELRDQLSSRSGTQRYIEGGGEALMIVHELPEPKVPERDPIVFWRTPDGSWRGPDNLPGLKRMSELMGRFQNAIDEHEALIDETEDINVVFSIIRHAGPIARSARNMLSVLEAAARDDDDNVSLRGLRDRAGEIQRASELLYQDAKLTLDFWQAESAEEHQEAAERLNTIAFRLNLMAGFFLPLVAVAGLLGMNVDIPPFLQNLFWIIISLGLTLGVIVLILVGWEKTSKRK